MRVLIENKPKGALNMGKGDIRSRRGKTARGTFGNSRPKKKKAKQKK
jgi:ribosomal small subunit protein bTHX